MAKRLMQVQVTLEVADTATPSEVYAVLRTFRSHLRALPDSVRHAFLYAERMGITVAVAEARPKRPRQA